MEKKPFLKIYTKITQHLGRSNVAVKIIVPFVLFTIGIVWIVGPMSRSWIVKEIEQSAASHLQDNDRTVTTLLAERERNLIKYAKVLTSSHTLGKLAEKGNRERLRIELLPYKASLKLDIIEILNTEGKIMLNASGPFPENTNLADIVLVKNGLMEMEMADLIETPSGWALCAVAATRSPSKVNGLLMIGTYFDNASLNKIKRDTEDAEITIYVNDKVIATTLKGPNNKPLRNQTINAKAKKQVLQQVKTVIRNEEINGTHYQASYTPLILHQQEVGILSVRRSIESVVAAKARVTGQTTLLALLIILTMAIIGYTIVRGITNRIAELALATDHIAQGDFDQKIQVRSEDEIGKLARSFSRMVENLRIEKRRVKSRTEALTKMVAELTSLYKISQTLMSSTTEPRVLLDKILASAVQLLNADAASVMLIDKKTRELRIMVARGLSKDVIAKTRLKLGEGISGWVAKEGKPLLIIDGESSLIKAMPPSKKKINAAISTPIKIKDTVVGVINVSDTRSSATFTEDDMKLLSTFSAQAAASIENARLFEVLRKTYLDTVKALAEAIEAKDPYTRGHSDKVAAYAVAISKRLNLSDEFVRGIETAAFLHDIGKIGINDIILQKPGKLTKQEMDIIRSHPQISMKIIADIDFPWAVIAAIHQHHERYDGNGYPNGLKGKEIELGGRILNVADAFEAMTSDRPYRSALSVDGAIRELKRCSGTQFDPKIVKTFLAILREQGIIDEQATRGRDPALIDKRSKS